ncbi:MAG: pyruvate formate-lyase-activating protein [Oscillospiraceae bacterium]
MGYIHSRESFGAVDGPGIRYVLFVQGCALRCKFCHNPDTWTIGTGNIVTSDDIIKEISGYLGYIKNGGVTISGGEPLLQPSFVQAIINGCHSMGLHTAIDTAAGAPICESLPVIDAADLILLDIKCIDDSICTKLSGASNANAKAVLEHCEKTKKSVWLRHVLVPGITLETKLLQELADFASNYKCIDKIELLPFHKLGEYKWQELSIPYSLADTKQPTYEEIKNAREIFMQKGFTVI